MNILLVHQTRIPVFAYGGTERMLWDLGKALADMGHQITFMVPEGSRCEFASVRPIQPDVDLMAQIPYADFDIVHFQFNPPSEPDYPYLVTEHGNSKHGNAFPANTVFVSRNHAARYGSTEFVYNGLDWSAYGPVNWQRPREHYHFLGKGSWPVKNLSGAIQIARHARVPLSVMGGRRLNVSRGFRFTPWPSIRFLGMVGGAAKFNVLNSSKGLIFPVRWHEPFGLAVVESLYFGCPVFATPFGALPELVDETCGVLAKDGHTLAEAIATREFDPAACHHRATTLFGHTRMAQGYVTVYERILDGERLHHTPPRLAANGHALEPWQM